MIFKDLKMYDLLNFSQNKTLICFGAGQQLTEACEAFDDVSFFDRIDLIADNNKSSFRFDDREKPAAPMETCLSLAQSEPVVLITAVDCMDIIDQLNAMSELDHCHCFIYSLAQDFVLPYSLPPNRSLNETLKIPKVIHYCWFGGSPIRDDFKAYIDTWKKYCPDYEIVRWDESNYDYKVNEYMYDAYKHKKWGFVPDFARLDIIYRYGGVYFDTDVELVKNIDDLLCDDAFSGFIHRSIIANGLGFGAVPKFPLVKKQLEVYDTLSFVNPDGTLNLTPGPNYQTEIFKSLGLEKNNTLQLIQGTRIYPTDVLSPKSYRTGRISITENTRAIHHGSATWMDSKSLNDMINRCKKFDKLFPNDDFNVQSCPS